MKMEGAMFDLDGTLLDSMHVWETVAEDYLLCRGITPEAGLNETFKEMSMVEAARYYQEHYHITDSVEAIIQGVNEQVLHQYEETVRVKPGVKALLQGMQQQNIKMCIVTAADRSIVEAALKRNGIEQFFEGIITCTETGIGKESADIFEVGLRMLGTNKESTLVFEDALHAIKAARRAGFPVVAVYDESAKDNWEEIQKETQQCITCFTKWREHD